MSAALSIDNRVRKLFGAAPARPFATAADAVIWMMAAWEARQDGRPVPRAVCEPGDIAKALDRLYSQRSIQIAHARVLRIWGLRGRAPCPAENRADRKLWDEAIPKLETSLRIKGIVR